MPVLLYPKTNLKILSQRFRLVRIEKNYSLRGISRSENISHAVISDIENGKIYPNVETLKQLYKQLDIDLLIDELALRHYKEDFELFKDSVYYCEDDMAKSLYDTIIDNHNTLIHSLLYIDYLLVRLLYHVVLKHSYDFKEVETIEQYYALLSERQKQEFNILKGLILYNDYQVEEAIRYFKRNLMLQGNKKTEAMTLSHLSNAYRHVYKAYNAIDFGQKASEMHAEQANLLEKLRADCLVANELMEVERFKDAQQVLNNITIAMGEYSDKFSFIHRYMHYLWSYWYYKQNNYQKAYEILKEKTSKEPSYDFYEAYVLVAMKEIDKAKNVLKGSLKKQEVIDSQLFYPLNQVYLLFLDEAFDEQGFETLIQTLLDNRMQMKDYIVYKLVNKIGIAYYESQKECHKALSIAKAFITTKSYG